MTDTLSITIARLNQFSPCKDSGDRVIAALRQFNPNKGYAYSAADAREAGCTYEDIIWIASAVAVDDEVVVRRLTGFLNDNAKRVLHIFEEATPNDPRVRKCIEATDAFLAGRIDAGKWERAARDAWAAWDAWDAWDARAARDARDARDAWDAWAAWAAWDAWDARAARAAWDAWDARDARDAWDAWAARAARAAWAAWVAWDAWAAWAAWAAWDAWDAWAARAARAAWDARDAREEFHAWQFDRLIEWLAPEAPEPLPMPGRPLVEAE